MSAPIVPDFEGFASAQATLRERFGRDIRFFGPADVIYDSSIPASEFDDEGIPLDPLASGTVLSPADVDIADLTIVGSAQCQVVFRPLQTSILRRDQTFETQEGIRSGLNKDLLLDPADEAQASAASHYEVGTFARDEDGQVIYPEQFAPEDGFLWKIVNFKYDSFGPVERIVIYGQDTR